MKFERLLDIDLSILEADGLFKNINRRKRKGISRSKRNSTIDKKTYDDMHTWGDDIESAVKNIQEALEKPVDIKWITSTEDFWKGRFYIDDPTKNQSYVYDIDIMRVDSESPVWEISFYLTYEEVEWATYQITGTGNANTVFATVLHAIKQWANAMNPIAFNLTALEDSRIRLYKTLLKKYLPAGWNFAKIGHDFWAAKDIDPVKIEKQYSMDNLPDPWADLWADLPDPLSDL